MFRVALSNSERQRKNIEGNIEEVTDRSRMIYSLNASFTNQKRKIESDLTRIRSQVEECVGEANSAEEAATRPEAIQIKGVIEGSPVSFLW